MAYDPLQYGVARANILGGMASNIGNTIIKAARNIDTIVKQKDAQKKLQLAYQQTINSFVQQATTANPNMTPTQAKIKAMSVYRQPSSTLDLKTNFENLIAADTNAQKVLEKIKAEGDKTKFKGQASEFSQKMNQPIGESRQVRAEGPPIPAAPVQEGPPEYAPERAGEVPMERQVSNRPVSTAEYEQQYEELDPEAQKYVPEDLKGRVSSVEQIYQQPLKQFEEQRTQKVKDREANIKTMSGIDKGAGFHTAIIESQYAVEELKTKQKTLDELIKMSSKAANLPPKQIAAGKGNEMNLEMEQLASELGVPAQLANDPEFLGRMRNEFDRLIAKENDQQEKWELARKEEQRRFDMEEKRKLAPKAPATTPDWKLGKELQTALKDMTKQQFPNLYKVMEGEYGIDVMKQVSGVAEAARAIMNDPAKRIALAYAFPEEVGAIAAAKGSPRPPDSEIQAVLSEMQSLQDKTYGVIARGSAPSAGNDPFAGLGDL